MRSRQQRTRGTQAMNNSSCAYAECDSAGATELFPFPPLSELVPISLYYATTFVIGLIGNLIVLFVVLSTRGDSLLDNCLISLTVADLCVILFCVPLMYARWFSYTWTYGKFLCKALHYIQRMSSAASVFTLTAIALERFKAMLDSLNVISGEAQKRERILLPTCWLCAILFASPILHVQILYRIPGSGEYYWCLKSFALRGPDVAAIAYELYFFIVLIVGPAVVLAVAYLRISCFLARRSLQINAETVTSTKGRASDTQTQPQSQSQSPVQRVQSSSVTNENTADVKLALRSELSIKASRLKSEKTKQIISLLMATVGVFILCYAPLQVDSILQAFGVISRFNPQPLKTIRMITSLLSSVNSSVNPFVYCFVSSNFRRRVRRRLASVFAVSRKLKCCKNKANSKADARTSKARASTTSITSPSVIPWSSVRR